MDCTYKTNRFRIPLLNICSVTSNKKTIQIALCFLNGEKKEDYEWAIQCFKELLTKYGIIAPIIFITDRELALMGALDLKFPDSAHILCTWHVNMNILANCRKHFPKDKPKPITNRTGGRPTNPSNGDFIPDQQWEEFLKDWVSILASKSEVEYTNSLMKFRKHSDAAVTYVEDTWLTPWKEKLVQFQVDQNLHFGIRVTSPIKGCHTILKAYLKVSTGDLKGVFDNLVRFWPEHYRNILNSAADRQNKVKHSLNKVYFHMIQSLVHDRAMFLIVVECAKLYKAKEEHPNLGPCHCIVKQSMGIPCFHTVHERLSSGGYILLADIHPFWWYKRPEASTSSAIEVQTCTIVLNPAVVRGKGRPRGSKNKKGYQLTNTRRDPSQFEYALSSSALAVLSRQPTESAVVRGLLAHDEQDEQDDQDDNGFIDIEAFDEALIDPQLRSTTQIGIARIKDSSDTYCPGTLLPRLHQTNPFSRGLEDQEIGTITHELTSREVAPTTEELQAMADEEDDDQALSQAINTFVETTRAGRNVKASTQVVQNRQYANEIGQRGGKRGGQRGGWGRGRGGGRGGSNRGGNHAGKA